MSGYNLPPGVTSDMIPGNSAKDVAWEAFLETWLEKEGIEDFDVIDETWKEKARKEFEKEYHSKLGGEDD